MQRTLRPLLALFLSLPSLVAAAGAAVPALPVQVPATQWRPLLESHHPGLQHALENRLRADPARATLVDKGKLAVGLVDLRDPARPRFAAINGDQTLYAASLPKIAILWAAHAALDEGTLLDTPGLQADMTAMLRFSSNEAATAVIDRIGLPAIAKAMTDPRYKLYDARLGGGLWVGKRFARKGGRVGDPLRNISHAASATQVCRFYYLLATGHGLSPQRSAQMLRHLSDPGLNHYFVGSLRRRAPQARLYRKSGTWSAWKADSVLAWGPERRYVLVGLVEGGDGKRILGSLVPMAEEALRSVSVALAPGAAAPRTGLD